MKIKKKIKNPPKKWFTWFLAICKGLYQPAGKTDFFDYLFTFFVFFICSFTFFVKFNNQFSPKTGLAWILLQVCRF